jgi:hypothetical protein
VINKIRALGSWYTKGLDNGSHLRTAVNAAESLDDLRSLIEQFFQTGGEPLPNADRESAACESLVATADGRLAI